MSNAAEIAVYASRFNVKPCHAYTLPAIFDRVAEVANEPVRKIISDATYKDAVLGEYIAKVAMAVAFADAKNPA